MSDRDNFLTFSKSFTDSIKDVFQTMVGCEIKHLKPELKESGEIEADYISRIDMNGLFKGDGNESKFKGAVFIYWEMGSYINLCNSVLETDFKEYCEDIADFGMEISNMTMGGAKTTLNPLGYKIEMATPNSIINGSCQNDKPKGGMVIKIPFECSLTSFCMDIIYSEES